MSGRGGEIRTPDILLPKQARYQAALHPESAVFYALVADCSTRHARSRFPLALPPDFWYQDPFTFLLVLEFRQLDLLHKTFPAYAPKKGEEYMNPKQRAHFKKILESAKTEMLEDIERTVHAMQDDATLFADPNDRASQESDIALELRNRDRERKLIKKIDETIAHIESGDYGYCENCGVEIGLKRLEARPTATLCIDCKTLDELRERQVAK